MTQAVGVGGTGTLSGVTSLTSDGNEGGYCALLTTSQVDCWGYNGEGELGNGTTTSDSDTPTQSDTPTEVVGVGGTGT